LTKPNTDKVDKDDQADGQQPADSKNETDSPTKAKVNKDDATEKAQDQDKESLPKERFAATDALPDPGQKAAEEAKNNMQDPKPFDTKEYYVPIGNTHHKHGSVKAAMAFGVLCAVLAVAAALYYLYHISM
jgi:hypothetical protein